MRELNDFIYIPCNSFTTIVICYHLQTFANSLGPDLSPKLFDTDGISEFFFFEYVDF